MTDSPTPPPPAQDPELPGVPGYRVERRIGQGGMATVYLAVQESLERQVAIKVMAPWASVDEGQAQRFEHEARVIAKLEHPSIVGIHEVGRTNEGRLYYVMPWLAGGDLSHRDLREDEPRILEVLHALLDALSYAHARGIVHRDVKAENVLFDASDRPRLADFGIALSKRSVARITGDGMTLGSGGYMAPEQSRGEDVDHRADLYSVGVLAYELLTGDLPYQAPDPLALALMHGHDPIPRLPADKRHWQAFVDRAMAKNPEQRFRNATAMRRALEPIEKRIAGGGVTVPELAQALVNDPAWRKPWVLTAAGIVVAVVLSFAAWRLLAPDGEPTAAAQPPGEAARLPIDEQVEARALRLADHQFAADQVVEPAGANAAETWLGVLRLDPSSANARRGLARSFDWLAARVDEALAAGDTGTARSRIEQGRLLADAAGGLLAEESAGFERDARSSLERSIRAALAARDESRARALTGLSVELGFQQRLPGTAGAAPVGIGPTPAATAATAADPPATPPTAAALRPADNARLVTRAEFAQFAEGRQRQDARCRLALSPLRLVDERSWRDPGYLQQAGDPVVCVAFGDATALAAWLAAREGGRWRLPGPAEAEALELDFAVWTGGCAESPNPFTRVFSDEDCPRRVAAGAGLERRPLDPDRGYEDVGVLLLREPD